MGKPYIVVVPTPVGVNRVYALQGDAKQNVVPTPVGVNLPPHKELTDQLNVVPTPVGVNHAR